jgi:putative membrane protein
MRYRRSVLSLVALTTVVGGCRLFRPVDPNRGSVPEPSADPSAAESDVSTPAQQSAPIQVGRVNDATLAAMLLALNNTDISYARLVPSRSDREDVRRYAQRMLTDHTVVNGLITELTGKLGITAQDNTFSLDMRDESSSKRELMRDLTGFAFDSTYATNEISYHRRFLESIDNIMIPRARNDELKTLLTGVRPAIAAHLAHAEELWASVMTKK